jgi:hypothetical protein
MREHPEVKVWKYRELQTYLPYRSSGAVSGALNRLSKQGVLKVVGTQGMAYLYKVVQRNPKVRTIAGNQNKVYIKERKNNVPHRLYTPPAVPEEEFNPLKVIQLAIDQLENLREYILFEDYK